MSTFWLGAWIRCQLYLLWRLWSTMFSFRSLSTVETMVELWDKEDRKFLIAAVTGSVFEKVTITKVFYNPDKVNWPINTPIDLLEGREATWRRTPSL